MNFIVWIKSLWNKLLSLADNFLAEAIDNATKMVIGEFKDFAIATVTALGSTDLSSAAKRAEAIAKIEAEAKARGKEVSSSIINLLIELAVARMKTTAQVAKTIPAA